jgi:hypothetical protein
MNITPPRTCRDGPGAYPAFCNMRIVSFPGVQRPGRGADHSPNSSAEAASELELYLHLPFVPT